MSIVTPALLHVSVPRLFAVCCALEGVSIDAHLEVFINMCLYCRN